MDKRKQLILYTIIKEHIRTGAPVGSSILVDKYKIKASPATVRNEMADLENEGYIVQPYTSAGRIPTEKAYYLYIDELKQKKLLEKEEVLISQALLEKDRDSFKQVAKIISSMSKLAVFSAFHRRDLYYTGLSNFFQQPEFGQVGLVYDMSAVIDRMDEIIEQLFDKTDFGKQIMIGSENPFSNLCGTVLIKYKFGENTGMFGILGPIRMDYDRNVSFVEYILKILNQ